MIKSVLNTILIALFLLGSFKLKAHNKTYPLTGSWNEISVTKTINSKSIIWSNAQLRSLKFYNWFHFYQFEAAYFYKLNENFLAAVGGGKYVTHPSGDNFSLPVSQDEWRTWQQITNHQYYGKIKLENRYRLEQRFTNLGYNNRIRLRLGINLSMIQKENVPKLSFWTSSELFFTNNAPYFQRLRNHAALVTELTNKLSFQSGYFYQFDFNINDETGKGFFQIALALKL